LGYIYVDRLKDILRISNEFRGKMVSPGGAAKLLGVTRQAIYDFIVRDRIRAYKYKGVYGEIILIPLIDLQKLKPITLSEYYFREWMKEVEG
jgi:cell division ATPase FtsA